MVIGKVVKSNVHTDYVCQVYGRGEVEHPPGPDHYAFGTFVRIPLSQGCGDLVGVIYDTLLHNPDFGNLGPRLSPVSDLEIFSPDYLTEKATLVGVAVVGMVAMDGVPTQGVPPLSAQVDTLVEGMPDQEVRAFHRMAGGGVRLAYASLLLTHRSSLVRPLMLCILKRLMDLFPEERETLAVLHHEWTWRTCIEPMGGGS